MGTPGTHTRHGKKPAARSAARSERPHPAVAKLAVALKNYKEALEQQAATAEVLRAMSKSPGDAQPVFEAIVDKAHRLCDAAYSILFRYDGELIHLAAAKDVDAKALQAVRGRLPQSPDPNKIEWRAILEGKIFHTADIKKDSRFPASGRIILRRAVVSVPLVREGAVLGVISCGRAEARAFTKREIWLLKTFADQAVIAVENARLFNETKEALEQQTASSEILRVISSSPTDLRPVFDVILESATRLCDAHLGVLNLFEGENCRTVAQRGGSPEFAKWVLERGPFKPAAAMARILADRRPFHVPDAREGPGTKARNENAMKFIELGGVRTYVAVPLLRDGAVIGSINIFRPEIRPFSDKQIALVSSFANQAVIAIENARLFSELQATNATLREALEQQTATGEILKVIASATTEVQPVFDTIVRNAARLGNAAVGFLISYDGTTMQLAAQYNVNPGEESIYRPAFPRPAARDTMTGRSILDRAVINLPDIESSDFGEGTKERARRAGYRSALIVPLLRGGVPIGTLNIQRREAGGFPDSYVALLRTFADQAVIAIENVRLFNETKEALERQTATAQILNVISSTPTDVQPVFDVIVKTALRLLQGHSAVVTRIEGDIEHLGAYTSTSPTGDERLRSMYPRPVSRAGAGSRAIATGKPSMTADYESDPTIPERSRETARLRGYRSNLVVPMLREGAVVGTIRVTRKVAGPFPDSHIRLLQTFADQAVIAIENARLFNETKEALEQQTATSEILKAIARSVRDVQPVFEAIVAKATDLCEAQFGALFLVSGEVWAMVSHRGASAEAQEVYRSFRAGPTTGLGRVARERKPIHIEDLVADAATAERDPLRMATIEKLGVRTFLAVPLLKDSAVIGAVVIYRKEVRPFGEAQIRLLGTFADQAVIAIENARLFNETKEALEQQTAISEVLRVISGSPIDVQPVLDAVAVRAARLCGASDARIFLVDGGVLRHTAGFGDVPISLELGESVPLTRDSVVGRAVIDRAPLHIEDFNALPAEEFPVARKAQASSGWRTNLSVPLLREGRALGAISLRRLQVRPFTDKQVELVKTFADQAAIAIENVRLFKELRERTEALTKSVDQLTALGEVGQAISSTLDLETVLKTIVSRAVQLTGLDAGAIYEYDEPTEQFHLRAAENLSEELLEALRSTPIRKGDGAVGGTAVAREPIQIPETQDESYKSPLRDLVIRTGRRALLAVPLMREEHIIGALAVHRKTPGPFPPEVVELLKTFATQSALAIQNARLFREIAEKSRQLEVASQHKSQFLASMSHELRTPLNALLGFNEMILGDVYGEVPGDMKPPLAQMQASGKHLLRLINNVLDLAKIEAGRMELALSDYSVHDTVESVRSALRPLAADKGVELLAAVPADIPLAHGDPGRITQCLMNLAGNSLKFTKAGKVEISVAVDDGRLRYSVADTGIGIPPDKIESLFTEFKQTDATIASEYGGTGLGLSITKKFVEMHGGRIWVESEPGRGSTFSFEIPLRAQEARTA